MERLLKLVESLQAKIAYIDDLGMLDASVLGEEVHPRAFNALKRIEAEDGSVMAEEERSMELASTEYMLKLLAQVLKTVGRDKLEALPDSIHSGLVKPNARGVFFYLQASRVGDRWLTVEEAYAARDRTGLFRGGAAFAGQSAPGELQTHHHWRYYDLRTRQATDNRFEIANLIACDEGTARVIPDYDWQAVMDAVVGDVLASQRDQQAQEEAPKEVDPLQATVSTVLLCSINRPEVDRAQVLLLLQYLKQPMSGVQVRELREGYRAYQEGADLAGLIETCGRMRETYGDENAGGEGQSRKAPLGREHLRLVCFDMVNG